MLQLLSLATGLSFVYLLVSLVVSACNELVLTTWDQRAQFLKTGLTQLLGNKEDAVNQFLAHGLIDAFSREKRGAPSYITSNAFAAALLDLIAPARIDAANPTNVRQAVDIARVLADESKSLLLKDNPELLQSMRALFDQAGGDLGRFRAALQSWFDESSVRISGWYKRRAQVCIFWIACLVAIGGNIDSLRIIQGMTANPALMNSVVQAATQQVKNQKQPPTDSAKAIVDIGNVTQQISDSVTQLNSLALPVGWNDASWNYLFNDTSHGAQKDEGSRGINAAHILTAVAGWLLTAFAASLGAPFWFQTLQRFVTIRGNGSSPAEADKALTAAATATAQALAPAIAASTPVVDASTKAVFAAPPG